METNRPDLKQYQEYAATPKYVKHGANDDTLSILVCQIKIWNCEDCDWFNIPKVTEKEKCLVLREVSSIEISNSYKDPISKAVISFPRGTVIEKRAKQQEQITVGNEGEQAESEKDIIDATNNAELITPYTSSYKDGASTASLAPHYDEKGLIEFNRSKTEGALLNPCDIAIGNRIEIRLGYAYSEYEFNLMQSGEGAENNLELVFTGFITGVSVNTPLMVECENMMHILSTFSIPYNVQHSSIVNIADFLESGGENSLLDGTGLELSKETAESNIRVRNATLSTCQTILDVFRQWANFGIMAFMEDDNDTGKSYLRIGYVYYAGNGGGSKKLPITDKNYILYGGANKPIPIIQFDWDVAQDNLSLMHNDKKFIAVEATGSNGKEDYKVIITKHPDSDDNGWVIGDDENIDANGQFVVSRMHVTNKSYKVKRSKTAKGKTPKPSLDRYNIIKYSSTKIGVTKEELIAEAKQYWANYVPNGISGSISIFGDIVVKPAQIVGLVDQRQPEKNGYYMVESVNIRFGTEGYRKELTLPNKIASFAKPVIEII